MQFMSTEQLWLSAVCVHWELWLSAVYVHWAAVNFFSLSPLSSCDFRHFMSTEQLWLSAVCVHWAAAAFCSVCSLSSCDFLEFVQKAAVTLCSVFPLSWCDFLQFMSIEQLWLSTICVHWAAVTSMIYLHHMLKLLKWFTAHWIQYLQDDVEAGGSYECISCALFVKAGLYSMVMSSAKQLGSDVGLEENILSHHFLCIHG